MNIFLLVLLVCIINLMIAVAITIGGAPISSVAYISGWACACTGYATLVRNML